MNDWNLEPAHDLGLPTDQRFKSLRRESGLIETVSHFTWWSSIRLLLGVFHRLRIGRAGDASRPLTSPARLTRPVA